MRERERDCIDEKGYHTVHLHTLIQCPLPNCLLGRDKAMWLSVWLTVCI
jgi:hypothetical protein